ncbi:decarboxylase [archaeon]|jgi:ornithine decarboxylase|nr:decarboxylase [archaeon]MBT4351888.1 decarboxylase [archaeon]MBT4648420.1 decarboxylase [archaeon]MBT6821773.1 decarboxylase [archaeon]MBT7391537.1 decarboxylase [archaeon]
MLSKAKFILSRSEVLKNYEEINKLTDLMSYSYKTNPEVGKILKNKTKCDFSVHSIKSINQLETPSRIWYFAQGWNIDELKQLFDLNIVKFVIDNISDLDKLLEFIKNNDKKISLLLRMKLKEHTIHTGKHFVYGMYSTMINDLIPKLRQNNNVNEIGIHFHRKTQNVSEWSIKEELEDSIHKDNWDLIDYVNIGGGIPAEYKNFQSSVLKNIFEKIKETKNWLNSKNIKMIIEPGRFIAASPVKLETDIINIYDNNLVIDCSIFNAAMDTWIANIRLKIEDELEEGKSYTIKGCSPDSSDILRYKVFLDEPKIGDKIVFLNAGAYTYSTDFCNLPKLETVIVD